MSWAERLMYIGGISVIVIGLALLARRVAIEMDELGWPGWIFGALILILPPIGALVWIAFRNAPPPAGRRQPPSTSLR